MTEQADSRDLTSSVESYLAPLRYHRRTIALVTVAAIALGTLAAILGPKTYTADTAILIYPVSANPTDALRATERSSDMVNEVAIANSRGVAQRVVDGYAELGIAVTRSTVADNLTASAAKDSRVLDITYQSSDPAVSRIGAELATAAYLDHRAELNETSRQDARLNATRALAGLQTRLAAAEQAVAQNGPGTPAREAAIIERDAIEGEIEAQQAALAGLSVLTLDAAAVIDAPQQPQFADGPGPQPLVAGSAIGGVVLGVIVAWVLTGFGIGPEVRRRAPAGRRQSSPAAASSTDESFDDTETRDPLELIRALDAMEHAEVALSQREKAATVTGPSEPAEATPDEAIEDLQSFSDMYPVEFIGESATTTEPAPEAASPAGFEPEEATELSTNPDLLDVAELLDTPPAPEELIPPPSADDLIAPPTADDPIASPSDGGLIADPTDADPTADPSADDAMSSEADMADWDVVTPAGTGSVTEDGVTEDELVPPPAIIAAAEDGLGDPFSTPSPASGAPTIAGSGVDIGEPGDLYSPIDDTSVDPFASIAGPTDPAPRSTDPITDSAWEQVTEGQAPADHHAGHQPGGLVATRDLDELFDVLSELGAAGPVVVLGLSDTDSTAGLTVGFELADELRALGARVLLIDGRVDEPALNGLFDDGAATGLSQVLTGETVLAQAIRTLPGLDGLDLLPVGATDPGSASSMTGAAFERLLAEARMHYHSVVVIGDTVPADATSPAAGFDPERTRTLARLVDGVIVGTDQAVGTPARPELTQLLESLSTRILQLTAATTETLPEQTPGGPAEPAVVTTPSR